jgi:uncharacterized membrane protein YraQ (UPF0718 family)/YHS domain-containing protein
MSFLATTAFLVDVGRSLREGAFMFWETLWALLLGFSLSGAVQAFVSHETMQRKLGNHRPAAIVRASGYGMASSSCSYAASAMSKSLFVKGADFLASIVFMVASTNLVIELGIVLIVLMGWQFAVSEFIGGIVMIGLLAGFGGLWLRGRTIDEARTRLVAERPAHPPQDGENAAAPSEPWSARVRSRAAWQDSATYTVADLTMLRREMVIGYVVAGFLAIVVPNGLWRAVFLTGHGTWTSVENVIVGPFIALISFVCSIGNVPLAAALWKGGISFGGVVSFIFGDLIALPLLLIYRRYYGTRIMLGMLVGLWAAMSAAGLITEVIFRSAGLVPTSRLTTIGTTNFSWGATTYLNIFALALFGVLLWLRRCGARAGANADHATDPICGMQVRKANAPASAQGEGGPVYFCSDHCAEKFGREHDAVPATW